MLYLSEARKKKEEEEEQRQRKEVLEPAWEEIGGKMCPFQPP